MAAAAEGSTSTGRLLGANAIYTTPAFSVGLGYNTRENESGAKSLTRTALGATAHVGPGARSRRCAARSRTTTQPALRALAHWSRPG